MSITKVVNDAIDLNQTSDYSGLRLPVGTTNQSGINFDLDYLIVAGGGGGGTGITASTIGTGGGGGAGGLRTSYNNTTTTTNLLSFPSGKTAIATYMLNGAATDISGNYNGTESGDIIYNTGKYGGAAVFNGSNTKITRENIFDNTQVKMSASVWVKATDYSPSSNINILDIGDNDTAVAQNRIFISGTSPHKIFVSVNGGTGGFAEASQSFTDNTWNHIVATWDVTGGGVTNGIKIYLNGSLAAQANSTQGFNSARDLALGVNEDQSVGDRHHFSGSLDQIRIYNSELSAQDIANIYSNEIQNNSGGGGVSESTLSLTFGTPYTVTIGDGGTGGLAGSTAPTNGQNSVFSNITSLGGGAGGNYRNPTNSAYYAQVGGSGGGAAYTGGLQLGAAGTLGQGYQGGDDLGNSGSPAYGHGGGGGAAARGVNGGGSGSGAGGDGLTLSITGTATTYGGGGGGGGINPYPAGAGGSGGGGAGGYGNGNPGYPGAFNTGGGGGGAGKTSASGTFPGDGAQGGSGVVVLRYPTASVSSFTTTGTLNTPSTTDTVANNNYPTTNVAYYKLDGNANGPLTTTDLGTFDYPSGAGCLALYQLNGNANGYLTTTDLSTVNYPAGTGCIALYELNGNANDTSNTYNGGAVDVTYDDGAFDQAAVFNGSTSYINTGNVFSNNVSQITYSAWVYFDNLNTQNFIMFPDSGGGDGFGFFDYGNGNIYFQSDNTTNSNRGYISNSGLYSTNEWVHFAMVFDGTATGNSNRLKAYVNGNLLSLTFVGTIPSTTQSSSNNLLIGSRKDGNSLNGKIDQVRIFNTALSSSDITTLTRGIATSYSGQESNITYGTGAFGKAAIFNGSSSLIDIDNSSVFDLTTYSVSFWIYAADYNQSTTTVYNGGIDVSSGSWGGLAFGVNANKVFYYGGDVTGVGGSGFFTQTGTTNITNGSWVHVAMIVNGTSITGYVNGTQDTGLSRTLGANIVYRGQHKNTIGVRTGSFGSYGWWNGKVDQVRVFNTALSASQITTLARGSATAYNGGETNITWQNGRFNECAYFNGSNSQITINNFATLSQVGLSFWINLPDITAQAGLITKYAANNREFAIYIYGGNMIANLYYNGNNGNAITISMSSYMSNNTWHHIAYTADGTNPPILWIDGVQTGTPQSSTNNSYYSTSEPILLGAFAASSAYALDGKIDQVRIFSSAITSSQVTDLYNEHYQTKFTDGSDTAIMFTQGTGNVTFTAGASTNMPQAGALRTNTDLSPGSANSGIEVYDGTQFKTFSATIS